MAQQRYDVHDELCGNIGYTAMRSEAVDMARKHQDAHQHGEPTTVVVFDRFHRKDCDGVVGRFVAR